MRAGRTCVRGGIGRVSIRYIGRFIGRAKAFVHPSSRRLLPHFEYCLPSLSSSYRRWFLLFRVGFGYFWVKRARENTRFHLDVRVSVRELIAPIGQFHPILSAAQCLKIEERMEGTPQGKPGSTSKFETIYFDFHPLTLFLSLTRRYQVNKKPSFWVYLNRGRWLTLIIS